METSTEISYETLPNTELVGRARAATTFASIGAAIGTIILSFSLNVFSIPSFFFGSSLILSMTCFYFSWNMYHLGLNFEALYRDDQVNWEDRVRVVQALSTWTFLFRWAIYTNSISGMRLKVIKTTDSQGHTSTIYEIC